MCLFITIDRYERRTRNFQLTCVFSFSRKRRILIRTCFRQRIFSSQSFVEKVELTTFVYAYIFFSSHKGSEIKQGARWWITSLPIYLSSLSRFWSRVCRSYTPKSRETKQILAKGWRGALTTNKRVESRVCSYRFPIERICLPVNWIKGHSN